MDDMYMSSARSLTIAQLASTSSLVAKYVQVSLVATPAEYEYTYTKCTLALEIPSMLNTFVSFHL